MNALLRFENIDWWQTAGWTMIHFLWLGTAVALVAAAVRVLLRRASPNVRYVATLGNLLLLSALPVAVAVWLVCYSPATKVSAIGGGNAGSSERPVVGGPGSELEIGISANVVDLGGPVVTAPVAEAVGEGDIIELSRSVPTSPAPVDAPTINAAPPELVVVTPSSQGLEGWITALLHSCVPYIPWLWVIGTPLTFALLATGLVGTRRLERASQCILSGPIVDACARLAQSLRIGRNVTIAVCERIAAPVLVGIVRPIILLPPAAISSWSPEEIEMVLLHELAHVRRWDNLVNLLQRLVESLFFFHPAVWLASNWVRREREACCDAIVVAQTQRPRAYAEMLIALAARLPRSAIFAPAAASAMAAGPLRSRIRHILQLEDDPMLVSGKSLLFASLVMLVLVPTTVMVWPEGGQAQNAESKLPAEEPAEVAQNADATKTDTPLANADAPSAPEPDVFERILPFDASAEEALRAIDAAKARGYTQIEFARGKDDGGKDIARMIARRLTKNPRDPDGLLEWELLVSRVPRVDAIAAQGAWDLLGIKVIESSNASQGSSLRIVGGKLPAGTPMPIYLTQVGGKDVVDLAQLQLTLDQVRMNDLTNNYAAPIKCMAKRDNEIFVFYARERAVTVTGVSGYNESSPTFLPDKTDNWPNGVLFSSPTEGSIAIRAWREWGLKLVPATKFERSLPQGNPLKVLDAGREITGQSPELGPMFLQSFGSASIKNFDDLRAAMEKAKPGKQAIVSIGWANAAGPAWTVFVAQWKEPTAQVTLPAGRGRERKDAASAPTSNAVPNEVVVPTTATKAAPPPSPREDAAGIAEWEKLIAQTPRVDAVAVQMAWEKLGLKLVPASQDELKSFGAKEPEVTVRRLKIVGGNVPTGLPIPAYVESIGGQSVFDLQMLWKLISESDNSGVQVFAQDAELNRYVFPSQTTSGLAPRYMSVGPPPEPSPEGAWNASRTGAAGAAANATTDAPHHAALRYEGKTFNEWRNAWKTELSAEKRLEAVKALAAFGANGYGKEAATAILELVKLYDWSTTAEGTPIDALKTEAVGAFAGKTDGSPSIVWQDWLPLLTKEVQSGNDRVVGFARSVFSRYRYGSKEARDIATELLRLSSDESLGGTRIDVIGLLSNIYESQNDDRIAQRLTELLNDKEADARSYAYRALYVRFSSAAANAEQAVRSQAFGIGGGGGGRGRRGGGSREIVIPPAEYRPELLELLKRYPEMSGDVIPTLGYLGEKAVPAVPHLLSLTLDENVDLALAAAVAVGKITGSDQAVNEHLNRMIAAGKPTEQVERARAALAMLQQYREQEASASAFGSSFGGRGAGGGGRGARSGGRGGRGAAGRGAGGADEQ